MNNLLNKIKEKSVIWLTISFILALALITFFADILFPFIFGMILAYFLDPIVDRLEGFGLGRFVSSIFVMTLTLGVIFVSAILVIPNLTEQARTVIILLPDFVYGLLLKLENFLPLPIDKEVLINDGISTFTESAQKYGGGVASQLASYAFALIDFIILFLIVPIITFYLLMDWNKITSTVSTYIPRKHSKEIHHIISEIDQTLSGFIRGQLLVCLILGLYYSTSLFWIGLNYCFLIGFFAGLISFIPFLGALLGAFLGLSVAFVQFWDTPNQILIVAIIFVLGQVLEGNLLTPKLVGNAVKLHPVLLMLAVSIGGAVAGLSGILLSVPVAAIFGVLARYFLRQYRKTAFFESDG